MKPVQVVINTDEVLGVELNLPDTAENGVGVVPDDVGILGDYERMPLHGGHATIEFVHALL